MSRICGVLGRVERLAAMLGELGAGAGGRALEARGVSWRGEQVGMGWYGLGGPALDAADGLVCVLDGVIYNRTALVGGGAADSVAGESPVRGHADREAAQGPVRGTEERWAGVPAQHQTAAAASGAQSADDAARSTADAALLVRLTRAHGFVEAVRRVNGDFAAALWDERDRTLWLARDRAGVRPLYYAARADGGLAFASRPRPLLRLPGVGRALDSRFVGVFAGSHYRYFDNRPERSPYVDVAQVPAAHVVRVRPGDVLVTRYWELADSPDLDGEPDELAERYRDLLLDAVGLRVAAAARPAFTLSGGLDSSSVLSAAVHLTGERRHAYSTLYPGSAYDESEEIRSMLDAAVAEWHPLRVEAPDLLDRVGRMIEAHDEPVATATWLSHHLLCEQVAVDGFDTLFGGLGGDELNAGEYEHFLFRFADLRFAGREEELAHEVACWARHHDHPVFRKDAAAMEAALSRVADLTQPGRVLPDRSRIDRYARALAPGAFELRRYAPLLDHPFGSYLKNRTHQDLFRETAPCCLRAEDRHGAAFGLRTCDPFFDHRLLELMFRVPGELKIADGVTKRLLRLAMRGILPEATRTRIKKTGWNAPADQWFAGAGAEAVQELLADDFRAAGLYDVAEVRRLLREHDEIVTSGRAAENHMMFFWQLVNLELWLRWVERL